MLFRNILDTTIAGCKMKLNNISIGENNQTAVFKTVVLATLFVFGFAQLSAAQERLAMLTRTSVSVTSYEPVDTTTVKAAKPAAKTSVFDLMGSSSPLEESLVMDFAAQKKMDASATISLTSEEAHPKAGWNAFQKYISTVAISPDGKCGAVKLSFTVGASGVINDCKVTTGLSEAADKKAVELIKNGPTWANPSETKEVSVTVNFHSMHTDKPEFL